MDKRYFGTDGIRDVANAGNLKPGVILRIAQALAEVLRKRAGEARRRVGLGSDARISQDMIRGALTAGFTSLGSDVIDFGTLPTPALAHLTRARGLDLGIMISASHNPMGDNGIKIFDGDGFKLADHMEKEVERLVEDPAWQPALPTGAAMGRGLVDATGLEEYVTHLVSAFKGVRLEQLRVAVDCANGATWKMAPEVLNRMGAKVVVMANNPDGTNINLDCGSVYPERLAERVLSEKCHLGIALDGDGDRSTYVDEKGRVLNGDHIMAFLAPWMRDQGRLEKATVVATVMSNLGLELSLKAQGIRLERTAVGDRHVTARLREGGFTLGGEQSGHIIFGPENHYTGDGVFTSLNVLQFLVESGRPLSELALAMEDCPQELINVEVASKPPLEEIPLLMDRVRLAETELGGEGRVVLRYSGTERKARVMVEGRDPDRVAALAREIAETLQKEIG